MDEHLFYRNEYDVGIGKEVQYRINGIMSPKERDLIQDALNLYKKKLQEEPCFSKILNERKNNILSTLGKLIIKFDTMDWRENKWKIGQETLTVFTKH